MKAKLLFSLMFFIGFFGSISADPIDTTLAKTVAKNLYWQRVPIEKGISYSVIEPELVYTRQENGNDIYYVFNLDDNKGFVIISADDDAYPVLGYSFEGTYTNENQPLAFIDWMNHYKEQILYIKENNLKADNKITNEWSNLKTFNPTPKALKSVEPLLKEIAWGQGKYYNASCPIDANGTDGRAKVGCVAVAMGQVMKYHSHPTVGTDYWEYDHTIVNGYSNDYDTLHANFGATTYDWSNIPNSASNYNSDLATLLYHCGVSVEMNYGPSLSVASTSDVDDALENYFGYDPSAQYIIKTDETQWENDLKNELDASRPIVYRGSNASGNGHAFVCDGYQGTNYFHFNWGWDGPEGYYYLEDLNHLILYPYNQAAVVGIKPYIPGSIPPTLTNPHVSPVSGTISNTYQYFVDYYDADGDVPASGSKTAFINNGSSITPYQMSLYSGTASNGTFSYTTSSLPIGTHSYFFSFTNIAGQTINSSWETGPSVYSDGNIIINPVINCSRISSDLTLAYSLTGLGEWTYFSISDNPNLDPISFTSGSTIWFEASVTSENYEYLNKWELVKDGNIELERTSSTWSIVFNPSASGAYTLNTYYEYTPQEYTISGTVLRNDGALVPDGVEFNLTSPEQTVSYTSTNGTFSFTGVKGGVSVTVTASANGYAFSPASLIFNNLKTNHTNESIVAYSNDVFAPITVFTNKPDNIISNTSVSFEWVGTDDVSASDNLLFQYILEGVDSDWSLMSTNKSASYNLSNGVYTFKVSAQDEAGNINQAPTSYTFIVNANPTVVSFERTNRGVWASKVRIEMPETPTNPSRNVVLIPEFSGINDNELIPLRIYKKEENNASGSIDIISGYLSLDTLITKVNNCYFLLKIPDTLLSGESVEYEIEWGKIKYFGWQEFIQAPLGFPNGKRTIFSYLDTELKLWRCTSKFNYRGNSFCEKDGVVSIDISKNNIFLRQTDIINVPGECYEGDHGTYTEFSPKGYIEYNSKIFLLNETEKYVWDGVENYQYRKYDINLFDLSGNSINNISSSLTDRASIHFPNKLYNNNLWIFFDQDIGNKWNDPDQLWYKVVEVNGNEIVSKASVDLFQNTNGSGINFFGMELLGNNLIILWERYWETLNGNDRKEIVYEIRDLEGNTIKPATILNPPLSNESLEVNDEYSYSSKIDKNVDNKLWISFEHRIYDYPNTTFSYYYLIIDENGIIANGPVTTEKSWNFSFVDLA